MTSWPRLFLRPVLPLVLFIVAFLGLGLLLGVGGLWKLEGRTSMTHDESIRIVSI